MNDLVTTKESEARSAISSTEPIVAVCVGDDGLLIGGELHRSTRSGVITTIARKLLRRGYSPNRPLHVLRDGIAVFVRDLRLAEWAELKVSEPSRGGGPRLTPWTAPPESYERR